MNYSSITLKDATRYFDRKLVFSGVSLSLSDGQKTVLVGENGAGKTTLLRLMAGDLLPDSGQVTADPWVERIFVEQEFKEYEEELTVRLYLGKLWKKAVRLLAPLEFPESMFDSELRFLSGGQKRLVELAKAFATSNGFLLLDEPENHLDFVGRQWLIDMINNYHGGVMLVSHDQYVIDQVANQIIEIEDGEMGIFPGSFQGYLDERERRLLGEERQWKILDDEIKHYKIVVNDLRQWAKRNSDFSKTYHNKEKQLKRMQDRQKERPKLERKKMRGQLNPVDRKGGKRILSFYNFSLKRGGRQLITDFTKDLWFGEKICLFGRNGCGKTSLMKAILSEIIPSSGQVRIGNDIRVGYFSQDHLDELNPESTPIQEYQKLLGGTEQRIRPILMKYLFDQISMEQKIKTLSGGQKTRLRFAKLFGSNPELLLLDEPTNHLDRATWEVLLLALKEYNGTVLLISHDRMFVDQVVERMWTFEDDTIREYFGNMSEYIEDDDE